jgi:hypothetical protein
MEEWKGGMEEWRKGGMADVTKTCIFGGAKSQNHILYERRNATDP